MINGYEKLAKKREEKGFTYQDMADKLGISKCYYWQLEHKKGGVFYDVAKRIALILETKPDELFYEETNE